MHKTKHSLKHHASLTYTPMWLLYMYMYMLLYRDRKCLETDFTKYCSNECLISAFLKICCKKLSDLLEGIQKLSCTKIATGSVYQVNHAGGYFWLDFIGNKTPKWLQALTQYAF